MKKKKNGDDNQVCPLYCIETISEGECEPASKCPYFGVLTILGGTETTIYSEKGGEILGHHEGKQIVLVTLT
ncbi:MAG: hypothetical protein KAW47_07305 [Thermoplasmatales archaeon]|nr:hypothetical protein [Thermoplasmatales archaeon]